MASNATTTAKIPDELKPLYRNTVAYMTGLQNFLWGGNRYPGTGGDGGGNGEQPPGEHRQPRRHLGIQPGGDFVKPIGGVGFNPNVTTLDEGPLEPVGSDNDTPGGPGDEGGNGGGGWGGGGGYGNFGPFMFNPQNLPIPLQFMPREIADIGQNPYIGSAFTKAYNLGEMSPWELEGVGAARDTIPWADQRVTGFSISEQNPLVQAQKQAFMASMLPEIQNQMAVAGLGRSSSAADAVANAWAQMLPSVFESELGREERRIERGLGARQGLANYLAGAGGQYFQRQQAQYGALRDIGDWYQNYLQSRADARNDEIRRLQGIGENALFQPLGGFLPSTIGSHTRSK
jgi:hypothetical protein